MTGLCSKGLHERSPENRTPDGRCRSCRNAQQAALMRKLRAERNVVPLLTPERAQRFWLERFSLAECREMWDALVSFLDGSPSELAGPLRAQVDSGEVGRRAA